MAARTASPPSPHAPPVGAATTTTAQAPSDDPAYLRASPKRAQKLWQYLSTLAGTTQHSVVLSDDIKTANVRPHPAGDGWLVTVTAEALPQPATDLDRDDYDYRAQHGLVLHETGHILYTEFAAWRQRLEPFIEKLPAKLATYVKELFNAFEDGVIEQCLREDFSDTAAGRLHLVNQNLRQARLETITPDNRQQVTVDAAIQTAVADIAIADSTVTYRLLDPDNDEWQFANDTHREAFEALLPTLTDTHAATLTADSPGDRYDAMADCATAVLEVLFDPDDVDSPDAGGADSSDDATAARDETAGDDTDTQSSTRPDTGDGENAASSDTSDDSHLSIDPDGVDTDTGVGSPHPMPAGTPDSADDEPTTEDETPSPAAVDDAVDTKDLDATPDCSAEDAAAEHAAVTGTSSHADIDPDTESPPSPDEPTPSSGRDEDDDHDTGATKPDNQPQADTPQESDETDGDDPHRDGQMTLSSFDDPDQPGNETAGEASTSPDTAPEPNEADGARDERSEASERASEREPDTPDDPDEPGEPGDRPLRPGPVDPAADSDSSGDDADHGSGDALPALPDETPGGLQDERRSARQQARAESAAEASLEQALEDLNHDTIVLPDDDAAFNDTRWRDSVTAAEPVAARFKARLKQSQRSSTRSGTLAGTRPDRRLLYQTATGDPRVLKQRASGDDKRYQFVLILDRSGSMRARQPGTANGEVIDPIGDAERAVIQVATALEDVGVDVAIIDFLNDEIRVTKPFSLPTQDCKERLATGDASGHTPLGKALEVAINLLDAEAGHHPGHIVAMTDDDPTDTDRYRQAFSDSPYPVHGTLINLTSHQTGSVDASADLYDTTVSVTSTSELRDRILTLATTLAVPE